MATADGVPELVLYGPRYAPFVEKVVRALALKKLPYRLVEPKGPDDYRRLNPKTGLLPVMDFGPERVPDSECILDEIDGRWPQPPLVSSDPKVAEAQKRLERWVGETFFFYWVHYLRAQARARDVRKSASEPVDGSGGPLAKLGLLRRFTEAGPSGMRSSFEGGDREMGREFADRFHDLAGFLGNRPFFYADRISRADLAVYSFLRATLRSDPEHGPAMLRRNPALLEFADRVEQETGPPTE